MKHSWRDARREGVVCQVDIDQLWKQSQACWYRPFKVISCKSMTAATIDQSVFCLCKTNMILLWSDLRHFMLLHRADMPFWWHIGTSRSTRVPEKSTYFKDPARAGHTSSVMLPCKCSLLNNRATTPPTMVQLIAALLGNRGAPEPSTPTGKQQCTPLQLQC